MLRRFSGIAILLSAMGCLLLACGVFSGDTAVGAAPATTASDCDPAWSVVSSPNVGTHTTNHLQAVAVASANDVWAVGYYCTVSDCFYSYQFQTLIEHWDGNRWTVVPSPVLDSSESYLYGVAVVSPNDVWAVGYDRISTTYFYKALIEHWDGSTWTIVPSPNAGPGAYSFLQAVAVVSANNVWAVGYATDATGTGSTYTLVEHWDGTAWTVVSSPSPTTPNNELLGVAVVSASDVWAVGWKGEYGTWYQTLVEHWDGTTWSIVPSPSLAEGSSGLVGVAAASASDVWTVGWHGGQTLVEHWDGTQWSVVASPNLGSSGLAGVAAMSSNDVWAVGQSLNTRAYQPLIEHWDGTAWSVVPSPQINTGPALMSGVGLVSANNIWAVGGGAMFALGDGGQTVVEHYTSLCITPTPTVTFSDVNPSDYFYDAVRYLSSHGVISGYSDGTFRPYDEATRAQVTKIIVLAMGWQLLCPSVAHFSDVPIDDVFFCFVEAAYAHGIINGYDGGTFQPGANMTRSQLCKVVVLAMGWLMDTSGGPHFTDVPQSSLFYGLIETAVHHGIISGYNDGTFKPNDNTMRGQICKIVYGAIRNP